MVNEGRRNVLATRRWSVDPDLSRCRSSSKNHDLHITRSRVGFSPVAHVNWKHLKTLRLGLSLLFFFSACGIFLDIVGVVPVSIISFLTSLQFVPSLVKLFVYTGTATMGLVLVIVLTVLFGRVYCSTMCPLGTFQDFIIRLSRRERRRRWYRYRRSDFSLHYLLTAAILLSALSGSMVLLNLVEPFSNFGRIAVTLAKPIVIYINNALSFLVSRTGLYLLTPVQYPKFLLPVTGAAAAFVVLVVWLSYTRGRRFCNLLCPAGALLGIAARLSLFRIVINKDSCTGCKLCEKVCKAGCIDSENKSIDAAACVGCFNCMESCHTDGVIYAPFWKLGKEIPQAKFDRKRREMLSFAASSAAAAVLPASGTARTVSYDECKKHPVTPPGSLGIAHFSTLCTACHLCVSSCPTLVLQPAFAKYGFAGILQPEMDYGKSFCNYDCTICTEICPTGAIVPLLPEEKKLVQMGRAKFIRDDCIVITKKKDCGACSEHCPTKAVTMVLTEGVFLPVVQEAVCTGCGACEHACPTVPRKAIVVEPNELHRRAEKPAIKKSVPKAEELQEFPF